MVLMANDPDEDRERVEEKPCPKDCPCGGRGAIYPEQRIRTCEHGGERRSPGKEIPCPWREKRALEAEVEHCKKELEKERALVDYGKKLFDSLQVTAGKAEGDGIIRRDLELDMRNRVEAGDKRLKSVVELLIVERVNTIALATMVDGKKRPPEAKARFRAQTEIEELLAAIK